MGVRYHWPAVLLPTKSQSFGFKVVASDRCVSMRSGAFLSSSCMPVSAHDWCTRECVSQLEC